VNLATERSRAIVLAGTRPDALRAALQAAGCDAATARLDSSAPHVPTGTARTGRSRSRAGGPALTGAGQGAAPGTILSVDAPRLDARVASVARAASVMRAAAHRLNGEGARVALAALFSPPLLAGMALHALAALGSGASGFDMSGLAMRAPGAPDPNVGWMLPGPWQFALVLPVQVWLGTRCGPALAAWTFSSRSAAAPPSRSACRRGLRPAATRVTAGALLPERRARHHLTCCSTSGGLVAPAARPPRRSAPWLACAPTPSASPVRRRRDRTRPSTTRSRRVAARRRPRHRAVQPPPARRAGPRSRPRAAAAALEAQGCTVSWLAEPAARCSGQRQTFPVPRRPAASSAWWRSATSCASAPPATSPPWACDVALMRADPALLVPPTRSTSSPASSARSARASPGRSPTTWSASRSPPPACSASRSPAPPWHSAASARWPMPCCCGVGHLDRRQEARPEALPLDSAQGRALRIHLSQQVVHRDPNA